MRMEGSNRRLSLHWTSVSSLRRQPMASKQYGLKIVHKPSNTVESESWFNTEQERNSAMAGTTMRWCG
jgi:hypothetical protein